MSLRGYFIVFFIFGVAVSEVHPLPELSLQISGLADPIDSGGEYHVNFTVTNDGPDGTGSDFIIGTYLSADSLFNEGDELIYQETVSAMPDKNSHSSGFDFSIPATASGINYVIFFVDAGEAIVESNEDNNFDFQYRPIEPQNVMLDTWSFSATNINAGDSFTISYVITNNEGKQVNAWLGATLQDADGNFYDDEGNDEFVNLQPGTETHTRTYTVPPSLSEGSVSIRLSVWFGDRKPFIEGNRIGDSEWLANTLQIGAQIFPVKGRLLFDVSWSGGSIHPVRQQDVVLYVNNIETESVSTGNDGWFQFETKVIQSDQVSIQISSENKFGIVKSSEEGELYTNTYSNPTITDTVDFGNIALQSIDVEGKVSGESAPWIILDSIRMGYELVEDLKGDDDTGIGQVSVIWNLQTNEGSYYSPVSMTISIDSDDGNRPGIILHEYGHYIDGRFDLINGIGGRHALIDTKIYGPPYGDQDLERLALSEGWANFFATATVRRIRTLDNAWFPFWNNVSAFELDEDQIKIGSYNVETGEIDVTDGEIDGIAFSFSFETLSGPRSEAAIYGALYDIMDTNSDENDTGTLEDNVWVDSTFVATTDPLSITGPDGLKRIWSVLRYHSVASDSTLESLSSIREFPERWEAVFNDTFAQEIETILKTRRLIDIIGSPDVLKSADFNNDGTVDLDDFFLLADVFGEDVPPVETMFDLNDDKSIDFDDFFLFSDQFGN